MRKTEPFSLKQSMNSYTSRQMQPFKSASDGVPTEEILRSEFWLEESGR